MLRNDPPPGTRVLFLRTVQGVPRHTRGSLVTRGGYHRDLAGDVFSVRVAGVEQAIRVRRDEIVAEDEWGGEE